MANVKTLASGGGHQMGHQLMDIGRCPHCGVAAPSLLREWASVGPTERQDGKPGMYWAAFRCATCGSISSAAATLSGQPAKFTVVQIFPAAKTAHADLPPMAKQFLQQAYETLHAPDAAAMVAGSAVDAMLKAHGLVEGTLYVRIDEALKKNILTQGMADWAHEVRLGSNRPRHADAENPHVSPVEAQQSVEFAEALGTFLFVLTARIERGIVAAKGVEAD